MAVSLPIRLDISVPARTRHGLHLEQSADGPKRLLPQAAEYLPRAKLQTHQSSAHLNTWDSSPVADTWTRHDTKSCGARLVLCCDAKSGMRCTQRSNERPVDIRPRYSHGLPRKPGIKSKAGYVQLIGIPNLQYQPARKCSGPCVANKPRDPAVCRQPFLLLRCGFYSTCDALASSSGGAM